MNANNAVFLAFRKFRILNLLEFMVVYTSFIAIIFRDVLHIL